MRIYKFLFIGGVAILLLAGIPGAEMYGGVVWKLPFFVVGWGLAVLVWRLIQWEPKRLVRRYRSFSPRGLFNQAVMTLMLSGYFFLGLCWTNQLLDFSSTYAVKVRVVDVGSRHVRKSNFGFVVVEGWPGKALLELPVSDTELSYLASGDHLELTVGDGLFSVPYVVGYRKLD